MATEADGVGRAGLAVGEQEGQAGTERVDDGPDPVDVPPVRALPRVTGHPLKLRSQKEHQGHRREDVEAPGVQTGDRCGRQLAHREVEPRGVVAKLQGVDSCRDRDREAAPQGKDLVKR